MDIRAWPQRVEPLSLVNKMMVYKELTTQSTLAMVLKVTARDCKPHLGVVFYNKSSECVSVSLGQLESLTHSPRPWVRPYKCAGV